MEACTDDVKQFMVKEKVGIGLASLTVSGAVPKM